MAENELSVPTSAGGAAPQGLEPDTAVSIKAMRAGGMFPTAKSFGLALTKMLLGRGLGLRPVDAQWAIHIVPEKPPSLSSQYLAARVKVSRKYDYRVREWTREVCRIEFFERS